jgi:hypothetical protein
MGARCHHGATMTNATINRESRFAQERANYAADQLMFVAMAPAANFVINLAALPDLKTSSYP